MRLRLWMFEEAEAQAQQILSSAGKESPRQAQRITVLTTVLATDHSVGDDSVRVGEVALTGGIRLVRCGGGHRVVRKRM